MDKTDRGCLSGAVLKVIACISMFIDHFSAIVLWNALKQMSTADNFYVRLMNIYHAGRAIGRIAFVLFAYLIVEGFFHTRSRCRFLCRLGLFALISEIPYDLAFRGQCFDFSVQNIYFTLFLGVLALAAWEWAGIHAGVLCGYGVIALCGMAAYLFRTDYRYTGILLIFIFYLMHDACLFSKIIVAGIVMFLGTWSANCLRYGESFSIQYLFCFSLKEMYGMAAFLPIAFYDGSRGRQLPKLFWYGFYPLHLLLLYGIARLMNVL